LFRRPLCLTLFPYTTLFRSCFSANRRRLYSSNSIATGGCPAPWSASRPNGRSSVSPCRPLSMLSCQCRICCSQCYLHPVHSIRRSEEHTSELQSRSDLVCRL